MRAFSFSGSPREKMRRERSGNGGALGLRELGFVHTPPFSSTKPRAFALRRRHLALVRTPECQHRESRVASCRMNGNHSIANATSSFAFSDAQLRSSCSTTSWSMRKA